MRASILLAIGRNKHKAPKTKNIARAFAMLIHLCTHPNTATGGQQQVGRLSTHAQGWGDDFALRWRVSTKPELLPPCSSSLSESACTTPYPF